MNPPCKPKRRIGFRPQVWAEYHILPQPALQDTEPPLLFFSFSFFLLLFFSVGRGLMESSST